MFKQLSKGGEKVSQSHADNVLCVCDTIGGNKKKRVHKPKYDIINVMYFF